MGMETKRLSLGETEVKLSDDSMTFTGYASVFGGVDSYGDTIDPSAFNKTIKRGKADRPIRMRWNHFGPVIGKWLSMSVDEKGLKVEGELTPGHSLSRDIHASMKHGAVDGLSIGYLPKKIEMLEKGARRLLKEVDLIEISIVEEPADKAARIDLKSALLAASSLKEIEALLRDGGFSQNDACLLVSRVKSLSHGERAQHSAAEIAAIFERFAPNK